MAFKKLVIASGQVSGASHSDFPILIQPSKMTGWEALTLAEAQSIRIYTDEAKTNEVAREVVDDSPDEIWVKVPTLTSSTELYVDYDGVRSDLAPTDTYGRNAVWEDYILVAHLEGNGNDSTGNVSPPTETNMSYSAGQFGQAGVGTGESGGAFIDYGDIRGLLSGDEAHATAWVKLNKATPSTSGDTGLWSLNRDGPGPGSPNRSHYPFTNGDFYDGAFRITNTRQQFSPSATIDREDWHKITVKVKPGTNNWQFFQNTENLHQATGESAIDLNSRTIILASRRDEDPPAAFIDGMMDEFRIGLFDPTTNWITTEYNNQNDVASFWGTVEDAGGDPPAPVADTGFFAFM